MKKKKRIIIQYLTTIYIFYFILCYFSHYSFASLYTWTQPDESIITSSSSTNSINETNENFLNLESESAILIEQSTRSNLICT